MSLLISIIALGLFLLGFGQAQSLPTLPAYMYTGCNAGGHYSPHPDQLLTTTAKMMDWCGCENVLNPGGVNIYSGMSVYSSQIPRLPYTSARTWVCSAGNSVSCSSTVDWDNAKSNVTAVCGTSAGYFYDALRQMAWGFDSYATTNFCDLVAWVGIYKDKVENSTVTEKE